MSGRTAVQNAMIQYSQEVGRGYVDRDEAARMRGGTTGLFFDGIVEAQLHRQPRPDRRGSPRKSSAS